MKRLIVALLGLGLSLAVPSGAVLGQQQGGPVVYDDASGTNGDCTVTGSAGDQMVFCSDLRPGNGVTVTSPPPARPPAAKDVPPTPPTDAAAAPAAGDAAVASATDQDADNAPDDLEPDLGLDPTNPDSDGDGVADGDELNIYGTDPTVWDSDGDSASDGAELFGSHTDPLTWDDFSTQGTESTAETP